MIERENFNQQEETLQDIKEKTAEIMEGFPDYHGFEHIALVVDYANLLAIGEGQDVFNAKAAAWTHDWGRVAEESDLQKRRHADISREMSKDFYRNLWEQGKITPSQYGEIQRAIGRHSQIKETPRETLKIVRDADRLSRLGSLGIFHIASGLQKENVPFYVEGRPIVRPENSPMTKIKDAVCVIDHLNICLDWEHLMDTESGKEVFTVLKPVNQSFLSLFAGHKEIKDNKLWLDFLQSAAINLKQKRQDFLEGFIWTGEKEDLERWVQAYRQLEWPEVFSEENFQNFLKQYEDRTQKN